MFDVLQVVTTLLAALVMTAALAHALEMPGKLKLERESYRTVQTIYYPGFTVAGIAEVLGIIAALALLLVTPRDTIDFWLHGLALLGLAGVQAVYWIVVHPVNAYWMQGRRLERAGAAFFSLDPGRHSQAQAGPESWRDLRDRWEYGHLARAGLSILSLCALVLALKV